jgi:hypothetical protein
MVALLVEPCLRLPFYEDFQFDLGWFCWRDDFPINSDVVDFVAPRAGDIALPQRLRLLRQLGSLLEPVAEFLTIEPNDSLSFPEKDDFHESLSKNRFEPTPTTHFAFSFL